MNYKKLITILVVLLLSLLIFRLSVPYIGSLTSLYYPHEIMSRENTSMLLVPAGYFIMGNENGDHDEMPMEEIYLRSFYIDKYEVTNEKYSLCVEQNFCSPQMFGYIGKDYVSTYSDDPVYSNYPVIFINWNMAKTYCEWREARLPTEAEWEKAARGVDGRTYPWGEGIDCQHATYDRCSYFSIWGMAYPTPVGSHEIGVSPYGVFDMTGNVWEWTSSLYQPYPYNQFDGREDDLQGLRVLRGGSWSTLSYPISDNIRVSARNSAPQHYAFNNIGFRCALSTSLLSPIGK